MEICNDNLNAIYNLWRVLFINFLSLIVGRTALFP